MDKELVEDYRRRNITEIMCPYCGVKIEGYDIELYNGDEEIECDDCNKTYLVNAEPCIYYSTYCDCHKNKEKHKWSDWDYFDHECSYQSGRTKGRKKECLKCDETVYEFDRE